MLGSSHTWVAGSRCARARAALAAVRSLARAAHRGSRVQRATMRAARVSPSRWAGSMRRSPVPQRVAATH
eukprot:6738401-Prymnesium_polylepis.1